MERWKIERRGNTVKLIDMNRANPWDSEDRSVHYTNRVAIAAMQRIAEIRNHREKK